MVDRRREFVRVLVVDSEQRLRKKSTVSFFVLTGRKSVAHHRVRLRLTTRQLTIPNHSLRESNAPCIQSDVLPTSTTPPNSSLPVPYRTIVPSKRR